VIDGEILQKKAREGLLNLSIELGPEALRQMLEMDGTELIENTILLL